MKCQFFYNLLTIFILMYSCNAAFLTVSQNTKSTKLVAIDENIVYRALTVIEGDILVDRYCECKLERSCRITKRNVIKLTKNQCGTQGMVCCEVELQP